MTQLDWIEETYSEFNKPPDGVNIWTHSNPDEDYPDLICDIEKVEGQYVHFYVVNGDWYGKLDRAVKLLTCYCHIQDNSRTYPYTECEFTWEEKIQSGKLI